MTPETEAESFTAALEKNLECAVTSNVLHLVRHTFAALLLREETRHHHPKGLKEKPHEILSMDLSVESISRPTD